MIKKIDLYNKNLIGNTMSLGIVCNTNVSYFILASNHLYKYDQHWKHISFTSSIILPTFILTLSNNKMKKLFVSAHWGINEIIENLSIVNHAVLNGTNGGLYFNSSSTY